MHAQEIVVDFFDHGLLEAAQLGGGDDLLELPLHILDVVLGLLPELPHLGLHLDEVDFLEHAAVLLEFFGGDAHLLVDLVDPAGQVLGDAAHLLDVLVGLGQPVFGLVLEAPEDVSVHVAVQLPADLAHVAEGRLCFALVIAEDVGGYELVQRLQAFHHILEALGLAVFEAQLGLHFEVVHSFLD